ncbi:hypothetical protein GCM10010401_08940 [Rarobacter faecitabidus]|uniref:Uncharacterized protein n=1 Tax=Rarobacter faecitabidus TaxID=13243 RepID=A0A542ZAY6_RARFA|nr:hypothetical protein [Rarobacter faecitabidus]TQL57494.1 hypothetical protein FB461_2233 [Rarobacter faecitabidus]
MTAQTNATAQPVTGKANGRTSVARIGSVLRLHFVKRDVLLLTPPFILALVVVVTVIIALILQRVGFDTSAPAWAEGARQNGGVVWSLAGFITYLGVQSVGTTFPFALAMGATRRHFALGTLTAHFALSVYLTAVFAALLTVEKATGHWFVGAYTFDSYFLGSGRYEFLVPIVLLGSWALLSIGGAFGAVWVRYGKRGPLFVSVGIALALAILLLVLAPSLPTIFADFRAWWLAILAAGAILLAVAGEYGTLRSASVR